MRDQDKNSDGRAAIDHAGSVASRVHPDLVPPRIEKRSQCASASIVERLAAPGAADTEFEAPQSGRLFRAADFS